MKIINTERKPIFSWCPDIEEGAMEQAKNLANLPFLYKHVAIMPDSHQGYGMPIGGVIGTQGVVIPNAVGVDIGCGMCALNTHAQADCITKEELKEWMSQVRELVPVGMYWHEEGQGHTLMPNRARFSEWDTSKHQCISLEQYERAMHQVGTLGGGNHFIEWQRSETGELWIMIHSGSRNIGKQVADHYNKLAIELNKQWFSSVPKDAQLAFLPLDSIEGKHYVQEMQYCVEFALQNRLAMMSKIVCTGSQLGFFKYDEQKVSAVINIAHNYAALEHHLGHDLMIHRKGATKAYEGELGIIPGSQGTCSYIVRGKGNPMSFMSCSHGSGRKMGRKEAQRNLNLEEEIKKLDDQGIIHGIRSEKDLDEAAGSYKNIDEVMANQSDLVEIVEKLTPLAVMKG